MALINSKSAVEYGRALKAGKMSAEEARAILIAAAETDGFVAGVDLCAVKNGDEYGMVVYVKFRNHNGKERIMTSEDARALIEFGLGIMPNEETGKFSSDQKKLPMVKALLEAERIVAEGDVPDITKATFRSQKPPYRVTKEVRKMLEQKKSEK